MNNREVWNLIKLRIGGIWADDRMVWFETHGCTAVIVRREMFCTRSSNYQFEGKMSEAHD